MKKLVTYLLISLTALDLTAQEWTLSKSTSTCQVLGTSTLHDWDMDAEEMTGVADLVIENGELKTINSLSFSVTVEELKSGHSGMDNNTYEALKSEDHPEITYEFVRVIDREQTADGLLIKTGGKLSIAGRTKSVYLDVIAKAGEQVSFTGETTFNMTDYDVDPPTAVMGTIKTGNAVTIRFNVQYAKQQSHENLD